MQFFDDFDFRVVSARNLFEDFPVRRDGHDIPWDELAAVLERGFGCHFQSAAARNLHAQDGQALDFVLRNDRLKLLGIVDHVQLRTADQCDAALDKVAVEVRIGKGGAVRSDHQVRIVKIRCVDRGELDLYRPVGQLGWHIGV